MCSIAYNQTYLPYSLLLKPLGKEATGWLVREEIDLCQYVIVLGQTPRWSKSVVLNWLLLQDPDSTSGIKR